MQEKLRREREYQAESRKDMEDYYAMWVHQIKAPIAVMNVLPAAGGYCGEQRAEGRTVPGGAVCGYGAQLCKTWAAGLSDLVIQEYELDGIIRRAVRKYAGQFIRKKIRLVYEGTEVSVLTDEKWLSFIIEQLLSNAIKYTAEGSVTIRVDDRKRLTVTDTGIGIAPEDLPRIFEKGYTGYNGRLDKKSTGIGLYLCRMAAERLGHKLTVESEPGRGSSFTIDLDSYPYQAE